MHKINKYFLKAGILAEKNGKLLLIKEKNVSNGKFYWNIIKGTFDPRIDKSILQTAIRECKEETNFKVKIKGVSGIMLLKRKNGITLQINLLATILNKNLSSVKNAKNIPVKDEEISEIRFFTKKELMRLKKSKLMNQRTFLAISGWLKGEKYTLSLLKELTG